MIPHTVGPVLSVLWPELPTSVTANGLSEIAGFVQLVRCPVEREPQSSHHLPESVTGAAGFDPMPHVGPVVEWLCAAPPNSGVIRRSIARCKHKTLRHGTICWARISWYPGAGKILMLTALRISVDLYSGAWGRYGDLLLCKDVILLTDIGPLTNVLGLE
jgi:hypothetical protein